MNRFHSPRLPVCASALMMIFWAGIAKAQGPGGFSARETMGAHFQPGGEFSVVILGSGGPPYDPKRSGPSAAIQDRGRFILVDMGNGTQARLHEAGIGEGQIDAFFITHHHRDHDEEFMPLLNTALVRRLPLEIVGTPGTKKLAEFTEEFYAEDIAYRMRRMGGMSQPIIQKPKIREVRGGESFSVGNLQVKTTEVPHSIQTVAYRFEVGGKSIVISGDLTYSENLIKLAHNADVLVMDSGGAIVRKGQTAPALEAMSEGHSRPGAAHASFGDVCSMAQKSGAKKLVLTHIVGPEVDEEATIRAINRVYKGQVIVGRDLLEVVAGQP